MRSFQADSAASVLVLATWMFAACRVEGPSRAQEGPQAKPDAQQGAELYRMHCAVCHGEQGEGNGPAYPWLFPAPRDFTAGRFRLVSTDNGVPTQEDLLRTLRRGMPGSAMMSWSSLSEAELLCLVRHVRSLAVEGMARRMREQAAAEGSHLDPADARQQAEEDMRPGRVLDAPSFAADDKAHQLGKDLFRQHCAPCHAEDGKGDRAPRLTAEGSLSFARDFTAGFLKGGATAQDLAWRIRAGMPGTPMPPAADLGADELAALVTYVRELIPPGSDALLVHRQQRIVAGRARGMLPATPGEGEWTQARPQSIVLSPMSWAEGSVLGVEVSALHDGSRLAIRLRWRDDTGRHGALADATRSDGAALQFSAAGGAPLFGMGSREHPTSIWHWKALRSDEVGAALELLERPPHTIGEPWSETGRMDAPTYHRELATPLASPDVDALVAEGVETAPGRPRSGDPVEATPRWEDGAWEVVFTRPLELSLPSEIPLGPGSRLHVAFAIWNGDAGDHRGQKSISIWHRLEIEE